MTKDKSSYEKIDYRIRPSKNIERKLLCESFRKLSPFSDINDYQYVGFGSVYFSDFILFHKDLGIKKMISVEKDTQNEARFINNIPFKCIDLKLGEINDVLADISFEAPSIVWFDYDSILDHSMYDAINLLFPRLKSGDVFLITVDVDLHEPDPKESDSEKIMAAWIDAKKEEISKKMGAENFPFGVSDISLHGWGFARLCKKIITEKIEKAIQDKNLNLVNGKQLHYKQLYNFSYSDGTKMLTVGGKSGDLRTPIPESFGQ